MGIRFHFAILGRNSPLALKHSGIDRLLKSIIEKKNGVNK